MAIRNCLKFFVQFVLSLPPPQQLLVLPLPHCCRHGLRHQPPGMRKSSSSWAGLQHNHRSAVAKVNVTRETPSARSATPNHLLLAKPELWYKATPPHLDMIRACKNILSNGVHSRRGTTAGGDPPQLEAPEFHKLGYL
jgi:hypothetical protein